MPNESPKPNYFTQEASVTYDERNRRLAPISDAMHFLIRLVLDALPARARVLCVGVGTGAEILALAEVRPEWTFVGLDPSADMLDVGRERLHRAGVLDRCELVHGYVADLPSQEGFDAALSVLVGHFVPRDERLAYYRGIVDRLWPGGIFVDTEISTDLASPEFPAMVENWSRVQLLMGATPESIAALPMQLREMLAVLPPSEVENLLRRSGIATPIRFFQAFMIAGWHGRKT